MKKILFILFGVFVFSGAFAAGENIPTSKSYVDSKLGEKQDIIPANDGTTQVLTNTGTAGEYGTKGIYDANGAYATQTQNLVDAATMNAGVQNAIDSEFQCIEWVNPNDHSSDCLLMDVFGQTERKGPNLLNPDIFTYGAINNNGTVSSSPYSAIFGPIAVIPGKPYTFSGKANTPGGLYKQIHGYDSNDNWVSRLANVGATTNKYKITVIIPENVSYVRLSGVYYAQPTGSNSKDTNLQFEQGSTATTYSPYGSNLYIPAGE